MTTTTTPRRTRVSGFARMMFGLQVFLLRRNWMGSMGDELMVITVTGRKSGRSYSTPIGFVRDGAGYVAVSRGSQWVRNAIAASAVTLEIKGRSIKARATRITDPDEQLRMVELYREQRRKNFTTYLGVAIDADAVALRSALEARELVRFTPLSN